jgi:hypothetical protein
MTPFATFQRLECDPPWREPAPAAAGIIWLKRAGGLLTRFQGRYFS